jgi:hypothetical protein
MLSQRTCASCDCNPTSMNTGLHAHAAAIAAAPPNDLQTKLMASCMPLESGIFPTSSQALTKLQITDMGVDSFDRWNLFRVMDDLHSKNLPPPQQELSTLVDGAFEQNTPEELEKETQKQYFSL